MSSSATSTAPSSPRGRLGRGGLDASPPMARCSTPPFALRHALHLVFRRPRPGPGPGAGRDLGLFDNDGTDPDYPGGDQGWQAVGWLGIAF